MKKLGIVVLVLVGALLVVGLFAPKEFHIESEILINRPATVVYDNVKFLKSHEQWNAWSSKDPHLQKQFSGEDGTIGFKASWSSDHPELGTAEQEITRLVEGQEVVTEIRFKKPFEGSFDSFLKMENVGDSQTKVIMGMHDELSFPLNAISFIYNVCLGKQNEMIAALDQSLINLKVILEK